MATNDIIIDEAITDTLLDERTHGWGTTDPTVDAPEWFWNTTTNTIKQNTGTPASPTYVTFLDAISSGLIWVLC